MHSAGVPAVTPVLRKAGAWDTHTTDVRGAVNLCIAGDGRGSPRFVLYLLVFWRFATSFVVIPRLVGEDEIGWIGVVDETLPQIC